MSGPGEGKVVFDADVSKVVAKAEQAAKASKKMVDQAAEDMGKNLEKRFDHALRRQALFAEALRRMIDTAGRISGHATGMATAAATAQGSTAVDAATAVADLRARNVNATAERIMGEAGPASPQERIGFLKNLHALQMEGAVTTPGGRVFERQPRLNDEEIVRLGRLFSQGGSVPFGEGGSALIDAMRRTRNVDRAIAFLRQKDRRGGAFEAISEGGPLQEELATRTLENQAATTYAKADVGQKLRRGEAYRTMDAVSTQAFIRKAIVDQSPTGQMMSQLNAQGYNSDTSQAILEQLKEMNAKLGTVGPGRLDLSGNVEGKK